MTGWEAVLEWSAGGPNRGISLERPTPRAFCVGVGLIEENGGFIVYEEGKGDTLNEAAAAALAAWRKRML